MVFCRSQSICVYIFSVRFAGRCAAVQRRDEYDKIMVCTVFDRTPSPQSSTTGLSKLVVSPIHFEYVFNHKLYAKYKKNNSLEFRFGILTLTHTHTHNEHISQSLFSTWNAKTKIQCKIGSTKILDKYYFFLILLWCCCCCLLLPPAPIDVQQNYFINAALPCKLD